MRTFIIAILLMLAHNISFAGEQECEVQIKRDIQEELQISPANFRKVTISRYLLGNGEHQIWENIGLQLLSVQYYHDSEFVEVLVKKRVGSCDALDIIQLIQHDM